MENEATIFLTLSAELKERIRSAAEAEHRSVNAQLRHWITEALDRRLIDAPAPYVVAPVSEAR